jgi:hypothetical protein
VYETINTVYSGLWWWLKIHGDIWMLNSCSNFGWFLLGLERNWVTKKKQHWVHTVIIYVWIVSFLMVSYRTVTKYFRFYNRNVDIVENYHHDSGFSIWWYNLKQWIPFFRFTCNSYTCFFCCLPAVIWSLYFEIYGHFGYVINLCLYLKSNIIVESSLPLCIWGSNLSLETSYPNWVFSWLFTVSPGKCKDNTLN